MIYNKFWNKIIKNIVDKKEVMIFSYESLFIFLVDVLFLVNILLCFVISNNRREGFI